MGGSKKRRKDTKRQSILRDFFKGLLFAVVLVIVKILIEHTPIGEGLESAGYRFLQNRLTATKVPIEILDISNLSIDQKLNATPREPLQQIIQAVADQNPVAIGIDIDFSPPPEQYTYLTPDDEEFFQFCLNISKRVPVYLGVNRRSLLPKSVWLGSSDWQDLGANITIPKENIRAMPLWLESEDRRSMSAALAPHFQESHCKSAQILERLKLVKQVVTKEDTLVRGEFLVDYSPVKLLREHQSFRTYNPDVIRDQGHRLEGKIVLIGDATIGKATDLFVIPGHQEPLPGILFHASAAYTLIRQPLYQITGFGRLVADVLESVVVLLPILALRLYYRGKRGKQVAARRVEGTLIILIVLFGIIVGVLFVAKTCVVWSDFLLALGALILHPSFEHRMEKVGAKIRTVTPRFMRWFLFDSGKGGHS